MRIKRLILGFGIVLLIVAVPGLRADEVNMQNGDRYFGKVLAMTANTVVLDSEILGKINVPRNKVASLALGTNAAAPSTASSALNVSTNLPAATASSALLNTNVDLSAALRRLGANTNFVGQIRRQMLAGNPEATGKFDEMVGGLLSGKMDLNDVRREAQSSAEQLRSLKHELGPEADDSLNGYLEILDSFIKETADEPATASPQPKSQAP